MANTALATSSSTDAWPALPLAKWRDTYDTLHRWMQLVGKTSLQFAPMENHWWQTALHITPRGIGTSTIPDGTRSFDIELDFIDHLLVVRTSDGATRTMKLSPRSVANFHHEYLATLESLGIHPHIWPVPVEMADTLRLDEDRVHASYDPDAAHRCWRALADTDRVLKVFQGHFVGKFSPPQFWWGGFDMDSTRFTGKRAPAHPGGTPNTPDYVNLEAYSHECMAVGWWPGSVGGVEEPAFYAFGYPEPPGSASALIEPADAYYHTGMHEWILPYDAVRRASHPDAILLAFCESTYSAVADLGHWDREALERHGDENLPH
jgi:hypothetical protein